MKILVITDVYPPDIDVAAIRVSEAVTAFANNDDVSVVVVCFKTLPDPRQPAVSRTTDGNVTVVRVQRHLAPALFHYFSTINPFTMMVFAGLAAKHAIAEKPDVIFASAPPFAPATAAYFAASLTRVPYCIDLRDNWVSPGIKDYLLKPVPWYGRAISEINYRIVHRMFRRACRKARVISLVYPDMAADMKRYIDGDYRIVSVPNGINFGELEAIQQRFDRTAVLARYGLTGDRVKYIVFIGKLAEYYRPDILFQPLKKLIDGRHEIRFLIVGEGEYRERMEREAKEMGLGDNVFFLGKLGHDRILELLLAADLAFYMLERDWPFPQYALGTKVLEYIACKLPVLAIAEDDAIVYRLVTEHGIGVALCWDEMDKIPDAIMGLLSHDEYRKNIERYYPVFTRSFSRERNNTLLYEAIRDSRESG